MAVQTNSAHPRPTAEAPLSRGMLRRARLLLRLIASLAAGVSLGCFSQHDGTSPSEGSVCSFPVGGGVPGSTLVVIRGFAFGPGDVRVRPGESVTWINCDVDRHTSTADAAEWASPLLAPGDAFTQTFQAAGEFAYHCEPHPFMTGRVIVE
jgi:plastocyanin